ncbi:MAG: S4 domain-containing protein [Candidatus Thorarchaeota archaeon]
MPRLDVWLVEENIFTSRQAAKRAIKEGLVTVDGRPMKPSYHVTGKEKILVSSLARDLPRGYGKLKQLDDRVQGRLVKPGTFALDVGSSAGGFLYYLLEKGAKVVGVEISETFIPTLRELEKSFTGLFTLIAGDAFSIDPYAICNAGELDVLLIDVTTDPNGTLLLIERFTPVLKHGGRLIAAFKGKLDTNIVSNLSDYYSESQIVELDSSVKEFHFIGQRG